MITEIIGVGLLFLSVKMAFDYDNAMKNELSRIWGAITSLEDGIAILKENLKKYKRVK